MASRLWDPVSQMARGGVVGRSANRLMALSREGAYRISSIKRGSRRSAAKRAGSRCARPRGTRSSRLTICRAGSAQRRRRELLPTCRGPETTIQGTAGAPRSGVAGSHRRFFRTTRLALLHYIAVSPRSLRRPRGTLKASDPSGRRTDDESVAGFVP